MKNYFILLGLLLSLATQGQERLDRQQTQDTLSLLFVGDIMGHTPQIHSAYDKQTGHYNYKPVFAKVAPIFKQHDYVVANLEVTLGGKPFTGYPTFSSPKELVADCLHSGINVMVTANNHSCDRGKIGITNTLYQLDSLGIKHTGTFHDLIDNAQSAYLGKERTTCGGAQLYLWHQWATSAQPNPSESLRYPTDPKRYP